MLPKGALKEKLKKETLKFFVYFVLFDAYSNSLFFRKMKK